MCKKLSSLLGKTPDDILSMTGQSLSIPVDISLILQKLKIPAVPTDFTKIEELLVDQVKEKGNICGMVLLSGDDVGIFYNKYDSLNRNRFTMAHELAHCCLDGESIKSKHIEFRHDQISDEPKEIASNTFAGKLLIPDKPLTDIYNQLIVPSVDFLASLFQVSVPVMKARLEYLSLDYFDPELNQMVKVKEDL